MTPRTITPPAAEPVSVDEFKIHQRLDELTTVEDAWIKNHITAARELCESFCNTIFAERTVALNLAGLPSCGIALTGTTPGAPARGVVVDYINEAGVWVVLETEAYRVIDWQAPSQLIPLYGQPWPAVRNEPGAVLVQYVAGYSTPGASPAGPSPMPQSVCTAILLTVGEWYENRENAVIGSSVNTLPLGVERVLWPLREALGV